MAVVWFSQIRFVGLIWSLVDCPMQGYFYRGGGRGHCPRLNFDNPKRSKVWYVVRSAISCCIVVATKCESMQSIFVYFFHFPEKDQYLVGTNFKDLKVYYIRH